MPATQPANNVEIGLNLPQFRAVHSPAKLILFIAGLGVGKSLAMGFWTQRQARRAPDTFGMLLASTKEQMRDATWPQVQEAWEWMGLYENEHYVLGRRPPRHWGVKPWHASNNSNIATWYWGAYMKLGSVEKFNFHRGTAPDYIAGDEGRDWKRGVVPVLIPRLRGQAFKEAGIKSQMFVGTTPPDDPETLEQFIDSEDVEVIEGTTYDNEVNLPVGYIDSLASILDEITFKREVLGERIHVGGMRAAHSLGMDDYPHGNRMAVSFDPDADTYMTCDFNASETNPMSWILGQRQFIRGEWLDVVVKEFVNPGTNTQTQGDIVYDWLASMQFRGRLYGRGDHTGKDAARGSNQSRSDHQEIERRFRSSGLWEWMGMRTRRTTRVKDRVAALNARLATYPVRRVHMVINPQTCPQTWKALRTVRWASNGYELEKGALENVLTALSYWPYYDHPVHRPETTIQ